MELLLISDKTSSNNPKQQITDIYTDHSHINPRGNEIMAKEIKKILIKNNLIK